MILKLCLINYQERMIWKKLILRTLLKAITINKINETLTNCTAGKLSLGYPESITPEEIPF